MKFIDPCLSLGCYAEIAWPFPHSLPPASCKCKGSHPLSMAMAAHLAYRTHAHAPFQFYQCTAQVTCAPPARLCRLASIVPSDPLRTTSTGQCHLTNNPTLRSHMSSHSQPTAALSSTFEPSPLPRLHCQSNCAPFTHPRFSGSSPTVLAPSPCSRHLPVRDDAAVLTARSPFLHCVAAAGHFALQAVTLLLQPS